RVVQARVFDAQVVENPAADERFLDDPGNVFDGDAAVPDPLGIDHDRRAMLALFEAAGVIGTGGAGQSRTFDLLFEGRSKPARSLRIAAASTMAGLPDIAA